MGDLVIGMGLGRSRELKGLPRSGRGREKSLFDPKQRRGQVRSAESRSACPAVGAKAQLPR